MTRKLRKFLDPLPIMQTIKPVSNSYYEIKMEEFWQKLHRDLAPTRLFYKSLKIGITYEKNTLFEKLQFYKWRCFGKMEKNAILKLLG